MGGGSEETGGGGRYVKYTNEQLRILENEYNECPKPSAAKRAALVKDHPALSGIDVKSIKVWFQNRRCREKQRKESSRLVGVNAKLTALNKLLLEENDRLTKQALQLSSENRFLKLRLESVNQALPKMENAAPTPNLSLVLAGPTEDALPDQIRKLTDAALEQSASLSLPTDDSAGTTINGEADAGGKGALLSLGLAHTKSGLGQPTVAPTPSNTAGLLAAAQDICQEFLAKATGTAVEWIQLPLLKSGAESLGITSIAQGPRGVAARVCGLVSLPAPRAAELLKDKAGWLRGCRRCEVLGGFTAAGAGRVDVLYTQMYAPTTLAPPRDFCTLRYTTVLDDGAIVICERSLSGANGETTVPAVSTFVRGEVLTGGFLLRPCDGGGCILIAVDHVDMEPWSVLDVLKPLYLSSAVLAHQSTLSSLRFLKRVAMEEGPDTDTGTTHQPAAWRVITERLARGFNEAVNAFADEKWVTLPSDGMDDVSVMARSNSDKDSGVGGGGGVLCARASMLLQIVPPSTLVRFMHDHRSEWADPDIDASTAAAIQGTMRRQRKEGGKGLLQADIPLAVAMDDQEFLELVKLEGRHSFSKEGETFLLQLCTCPDINSAAAAQLVFAPVDAAAAAADVPLLPSGFRVIPVDTEELKADGLRGNRLGQNSLDSHAIDPLRSGDDSTQCWKSVLSIAFQFAYEPHSEEAVAAVARQYVRSVVGSVQRVAMALAPTCIKMPAPSPRSPPGSPDALLLAKRVASSYRLHVGIELTDSKDSSPEGIFKAFWMHPHAIVCWVVKASPEYTFANKAGLEILGTSIHELASVDWNKSMDDDGRKLVYAASSQVLQQGYAYLPPGVTISCKGHSVGYEKALMWKVLDDMGNMQCVAVCYQNWSVLHYQ